MSFRQDDREWVVELLGGMELPRREVPMSRFCASGRVSTSKAEVAQDAESPLEHDFLALLDFDIQVRRFASQPFTFPYVSTDGKVHPCTPDVIVQYRPEVLAARPRLKNTLFEVKPLHILRATNPKLKALNRARWRASIAFCDELNLRFKVVTDRHIRTPALKNINFLRRFRPDNLRLDSEAEKALTHAVGRLGKASVMQILAEVTPDLSAYPHLVPLLWSLLYQRILRTDLQQPLTMDSLIWIDNP